MIGLALLGAWHVHTEGFVNDALKTGLAKLLAVWDDDEARGKAFAEKMGASFEKDLDRLLARNDIDAVMVECATTKHKEIILKAVNAKKHVFSDKALALTVQDCRDIKEAVEKNQIKFVMSMELKTMGEYKFAKKLADEGKLGRITSVYFRRAHEAALDKNMLPAYWFDTAQTGGGATLDLGCHGFYLLPYFCGEPKKVTCIMNELYGTGSDENSTAVIEFGNGAIGTAHTSFVSCCLDNLLEVIGTEGSVVITGTEHRNIKVLLQSKNIEGYESMAPVPATDITADDDMPSAQFLKLVASYKRQSLPEFDIDKAVLLTRLINCAYESAKTKKTVLL